MSMTTGKMMDISTESLQQIVKQSVEIKTYEDFIDAEIGNEWRKASGEIESVLDLTISKFTHCVEVSLEANDRLAILLAYGGDELQTIINRAEKDNFCKVVSKLKSYSGELLQENLDGFACEQVHSE